MNDAVGDPRLGPYAYQLPEEQIARVPPADRDGGRLLCLLDDDHVDRKVTELPDLLAKGDLLVVNDTRVMPARMFAKRETGGTIELLVLEPEQQLGGPVVAMARPSRRLSVGETLVLETRGSNGDSGPWMLTLEDRLADGTWSVRFHAGLSESMENCGHMPLPPYLGRPDEPADRVRYQTVYARELGAVAAPTAGLHLTERVLEQLNAKGVEIATVTLHVGAGTFRNLRSEDLDAGLLHPERWVLPQETEEAVMRTRRRGGRVVAVGTTSTRTLESAARPGAAGLVQSGTGVTRLFIQPGYRFAVVDLLMTNFHMPATSLLMLVSAFGGHERVMSAYRHAVQARYRFYSYGDAMLVGRADTEKDKTL